MKKPRPSVVEKIQAKQAPKPEVSTVDIQNVVVAARLALRQLSGADLVNVSTSIANIEAAFAPEKPAEPQPKPPEPEPPKVP